MSNQASPVISASDFEYLKEISIKYCPTVYDEINEYQPKQIPMPSVELRIFREEKKPSSEEQRKFHDQEFIKDYIEKKWKIELYNRDCFLRLYELYKQAENEEQRVILIKLNMFYRHIESTDRPNETIRLDFNDYDFPRETNEVNGWDD